MTRVPTAAPTTTPTTALAAAPATASDPHRPRCHFTAQKNWINDPNGLIWHQGEYHLFFQYNPYGDQWGHMSWGHAVSPDLLHWTELPVAIAEDERVSIYSGSVVSDRHNRSGFGTAENPPLVAIYTGCLRVPEGGQAQELAYSLDRGRTWTQYARNPVLTAPVKDFRDPKVFWHAATERWVMAVVLPDARKAQFHASTDLKTWTLLSEFEAPFEGQGIWECPDLLRLPVAGGADAAEAAPWCFKVDVFGGHPSGGTGARLFFGHFDGTRFVAEPEAAPQWADFGADFYAALSWSDVPQPDPDDPAPQRAVWLAWMNCHRYAKHLPTSPWRGAMSLPRELQARRVADGRWQLLQRPLPALAGLRGPVRTVAAHTLRDQVRDILLPGSDADAQPDGPVVDPVDGHALDIELAITASTASRCGLRLRVGADEATVVGYDAALGVVFVDRSRSGFLPPGDALYAQRHDVAVPAPSADLPLRWRVLLDACLLEVFIGDGEAVISEQIFPAASSSGLQLFADNGSAAFSDLRLWALRAASPR